MGRWIGRYLGRYRKAGKRYIVGRWKSIVGRWEGIVGRWEGRCLKDLLKERMHAGIWDDSSIVQVDGKQLPTLCRLDKEVGCVDTRQVESHLKVGTSAVLAVVL